MLPPVIPAMALISLQRLAEFGLSVSNERRALQDGASEYGRGHSLVFYPVVTAWMASTLAESLARGGHTSPFWAAALAAWLLAFVLRWWSILSLGRYWMIRILLIPGAELVSSGPYRYLKHPNYVAVMLEIMSVPLLFDAPVTALAATLVMGLLFLWVRVPAENRALAEHATLSALVRHVR